MTRREIRKLLLILEKARSAVAAELTKVEIPTTDGKTVWQLQRTTQYEKRTAKVRLALMPVDAPLKFACDAIHHVLRDANDETKTRLPRLTYGGRDRALPSR